MEGMSARDYGLFLHLAAADFTLSLEYFNLSFGLWKVLNSESWGVKNGLVAALVSHW